MSYGNEDKKNRKKYGLWRKNFPILGAEYYVNEKSDICLDFHFLFINLLSFEWRSGSQGGNL